MVLPLSVAAPDLALLRRRIGWMCQAARWAALGYALWVLALIFLFWLDGPLVGRRFGLAPEAPALSLRLTGLTLNLAAWALIAAAAFSAWRLFSGYREGRIFTPDSARLMQRVGLLGLGALGFDMICRPLLGWLMGGAAKWPMMIRPDDLLQALFLLALVAIGHIFRSAAELAEDNAGII